MLLNSWRTKCRKNCMLTHTLLRRISTTKTKKISRSVPSPYFMSIATFFTPSLKISSLEWTIKIWFPFLKDFNILLKVKLCDEVSPVTVGQRLTLQFISRCTLLLYRHLLRNGLWKEVWTIVWILIPEVSNIHDRGFVKIVKIGCDTTFTKKNPP